ncbi:MAG: aldehyde dehydrogenase family protein [Legionella sp.]|jgi:acyl-CoA reductase-like NAD-dependent aldehyde dehydrogenase
MHKLQSINPANKSLVGEVEISTLPEVIAKVTKAHSAKKAWRNLGAEQRAKMFLPLQSLIEKRSEEIALLISREMGKPISQAQSEVEWALLYLNDFIVNGPKYLADEITMNNEDGFHRIIYEPLGVFACITPWNFPFSNIIVNVIPLLIAGNTVVFKHSEECPLVGKITEELINELNLPEGVFAEVYGNGTVGQMLVEQEINGISFTGSSTVGKALSALAGKKQIKALLEMGGSDPAVLFEDVNLDAVIPVLFSRRFDNCGQICCAVKRLIVHESIYDALVSKLVTYLSTIKIGNPEDPDTQLGPLAAERQRTLLEDQIKQSLLQGAVAACGGKRPEGLSGAYYLPTILTHINKTMSVWKEELFGPVLPVIAFRTEEEAIELANDTIYGLSAVVFSEDTERARRVATQIDAGCVDVNFASHWQPCNPFGGFKASGMGRIYGKIGFQEVCQVKVIAE